MAAAKSVQELQKLTTAEPRNAAAWHELGNALLDEGKFDRGISAFRRALRIDDSLAEVHNDLGAAYFEKRWFREAEECFSKAIAARADHGVAYANLGAALRAQGKLSEGRRAFQRALLLKLRALLPPFLRWRVGAAGRAAAAPGIAPQELSAVAALLRSGRPKEALAKAQRLEERHPGDPDALNLLGIALEEGRNYAAALEKVDAAIASAPDCTDYHITRARILARAQRHDEAMAAAANALRLEPASPLVLATISGIYSFWRDDLAAEVAQQAVDIDPASDVAQGNLASALWGLGRLDEAERHAREAIRLNPRHFSFRANLALILKDLGRVEEALALYRKLSEEAPDYPALCLDMGILAFECEGDLESARRWYRKAQAGADDPRASLSEAVADLIEGKFESGWERYEVRKQTAEQAKRQAKFAAYPAWQGEALPEGRLLVYAEQGLGDELMFASMLPDVAARARDVTLLCDQRLAALFERSFPRFRIVPEVRDKFDTQVPEPAGIACAVSAGSLGRYFRRSERDFPAHQGYLAVDPVKVADWRGRLAALGPGLKVGLSWIGGLQRTGRSRRSLTLPALGPVLGLAGVKWISLQYTDADAELAAFREAAGIEIHSFPGVTKDIDKLAALITALDVVVSVCNTTVHVAGAVGKEVLVMAPFAPEWRYGLKGERMVWYPSARVFRQEAYGAWDSVIERVTGELKARLAAGSAAHVVDQ